MEAHMREENLEKLTREDVLKFVVSSERDMAAAERVIRRHWPDGAPHPAFYFSPVFGRIEPVRLVDYVKEHELGDVCVQVQLHKVIWDPAMRGV